MRLCASLCRVSLSLARFATPARLATPARGVGQRECHRQFRTPGFQLWPVVSHTTTVHDGLAGKGAGDEPDEMRKVVAEDRKPLKNITLRLPLDNTDDTKQPQFQALHLETVARADIMNLLDRRGYDVVKHPDSGALVGRYTLDLHDNMTITAEKVLAEDHQPVKNITLHLPLDDTDDTKQPQFQALHLATASRADIMKMLDRRGYDVVKHPDSGELVGLSTLDLHDNMTICVEKPQQTGIEKRVEGLEGFQRSAVTSHEQEATEALVNAFREEYGGNVVVVPISKVKSMRGRTREIDGVVVAGNVVGIVEATTKVCAEKRY